MHGLRRTVASACGPLAHNGKTLPVAGLRVRRLEKRARQSSSMLFVHVNICLCAVCFTSFIVGGGPPRSLDMTLNIYTSTSSRHSLQVPTALQIRPAGLQVDQCEASCPRLPKIEDAYPRSIQPPHQFGKPNLTLFCQCSSSHRILLHTIDPKTRQRHDKGRSPLSAGPSVVTGLAPALRAPGRGR